MRRILSSIAAAIALITCSVLAVAPAHADTIDFSATVTDSDPMTHAWPLAAANCNVSSNWGNAGRNAVTRFATVSVSGEYTFEDLHQTSDGRITILAGPYNQADVSNCLVEIDEQGTVTLQAGTIYTVLIAGWSSITGTFTFRADGPGVFAVNDEVPTEVTVTASPNPATVGQEVTLTATVNGLSPSGDVEFLADDLSLGTAAVVNGIATLPVSSFAVGTYAITADYSGDSVNPPSSTSSPVSLTVNPAPTFQVSNVPEDLTAIAGVPYAFPVTVIDHTGNALVPQPAISFSLPDCTITGGNVFETAGTCTIEAAATVQGVTITTTFQVTVEAGPAHALALTPSAMTVAQGGSLTFTITGEDAYGNPVDTSGSVLTSSVATDQIDGHTVTFPHASPHTITATLGAANDQVTIEVTPAPSVTTPSTSPLSSTGALPQGMFWAAGLGLLLVGAGAAWFGWHRRRNHS